MKRGLGLAALALVACGPGGGGDPSGDWYQPGVETTWQWQLVGDLNLSYNVEVFDFDLFNNPPVSALHADERMAICYFSAGSSEDWRPDFGEFAAADMGETLEGWPDERWLDVRSQNVRRIMLERLDLAVDRGCDGVEPDNVDGYANDSGFELSESDQLDFNRFLAEEAHSRGLAVGLKNDGGQAADLVDDFDFSLNEQCHELDECDELMVFITAGKPVFNAEYAGDESDATTAAATVCPIARDENIRTLFLPLDLDDSYRSSCDD